MRLTPRLLQWVNDKSIATKINLISIFSFAVIFAVCGSLLAKVLSDRLGQAASESISDANHRTVGMIEAYSEGLERSAEILGSDFAKHIGELVAQNQTENGAALEKTVEDFSTSTGAVATVFKRSGDDFVRTNSSLRDAQGNKVTGSKLDRESPAYSKVIAGQAFTGRANLFERDYMTRYIPIKDANGRVEWIAFIGMDFTDGLLNLKKQIHGIKVGDSGYVFIIDTKAHPGLAVIHPTAEGRNLIDIKDTDGHQIIKEMIEKGSGSLTYTPDDKQVAKRSKIAVFETFDRWGWLVISGSYLDEFAKEARLVSQSLAIAGVLISLILAISIVGVTHVWLKKPLRKLSDVLGRIAQGDLTVTVPDGSKDEVGQLLRACESMRSHLCTMVGEIQKGMEEISSESGTLALEADEVATGSREQGYETAALASAVEELTTSIETMSNHSQETREVVGQSETMSHNGSRVIFDAVASMKAIAETVRGASGVVSHLGTETEKISKVVGVIREIADQTNLLALNAAIEAARAGETGRGFAVVADEVRKLAERTTTATKEIGTMIGSIQTGTQTAVESMVYSVTQVDAGVSLANEAGVCIEEMKTATISVNDAVVGIADALREQTSASEHIARNVEEIAVHAENNLTRARHTADTATKMKAIAQSTLLQVERFRV